MGVGAGAGGDDGTGNGESALVGTRGDVGVNGDANASEGWWRSVGEFAKTNDLVSNILHTFGREHPHCSGVDVPAILSFVAFAPAKKPCMKSALIPSCPMSLTTSPSLSNPFP